MEAGMSFQEETETRFRHSRETPSEMAAAQERVKTQ